MTDERSKDLCTVCGVAPGNDDECYVFASTDPTRPSMTWHVACANSTIGRALGSGTEVDT